MTVMVETVMVVVVTEAGGPSGAGEIVLQCVSHKAIVTHHLLECMWCTGQ